MAADSKCEMDLAAQKRHEVKRSLICSVCGAQTGSYHLNYGASTCLSCRAFFRRTVQCGDDVKFVCKGDGQNVCRITEKNRKKCKLCRYRACVAAGMQGNQVMSSEDKKSWFRKMNKRKDIKDKSDPESPEVSSKGLQSVRSVRSKGRTKSGTASSLSDACSDSNQDTPVCSTMTNIGSTVDRSSASNFAVATSPPMSQSTVFSNQTSPEPMDNLKQSIETIKAEFAYAVSQVCFDPVLVESMYVQGDQTRLTKKMLKNHLDLIQNVWAHFCRGNMDFWSLSSFDQARLLTENGTMFQVAVLSRFCCSSYRLEQLDWLFLGQKMYGVSLGTDLVNFNFSLWNSSNGLLPNVTQLLETLNLMGDICGLPLSIDCLGILAYACLFHTNNSSDPLYENPDVIFNYALKASAMADYAHINRHLLQCHLDSLKEMSLSMTTWVWSHPIEIKEIGHSYGELDESLLQQEFNTMDRIFKEVPLGQDVVEELIAYAMDVPVSKGFMRRAIVTWKRRFTIIMKQHWEFLSLSDRGQAVLVEKACMPSFGVAKLWSENLPSVRAQIEFALGVSDISFLMERVSPILPSFTPKKLTVQGLNKSAKLADVNVVARFEQLKLDLNYIVTNIEFYKIMFLMSLFLPAAQLFPNEPVAKLSTKYLHILLRRSQFLALADEATINRSIRLITEIGDIIKIIFGIPSKCQTSPLNSSPL
ncbi:hypothetical protein TCAL_09887 [Tigriopus californicus]|uniref:Nuclear receptor domain-containing protein n=1 Tax=Tigriopus californicus TaxID=6832 RepID=A0A553PRT8_TIGCA|nr:uncharacterized protein LOC131892396 [Tigriopus californicus]TRY80371.1 hypothetical protein TCAL_09887 [Tigriopus californicus]|eukprot:TCALIF_09887-PA protein Name:"Similar to cnr-14 Steroid hormone receptor family member cnr14 (Caenorhabditis elegans)" AED:0.32 eAED:0.32 QI:0/-1/0/1/-1/1/1/0/701